MYNYNSSNELTSNSNGSYTYDANGNTLTDAQGRTFTWDFENRLTQAVVPGTNGGTTTFRYDPFGRRIQKFGPLGTTNYLYDGVTLVEEVDNAGNALTRYTQDASLDEVLAKVGTGGTVYFEGDAQQVELAADAVKPFLLGHRVMPPFGENVVLPMGPVAAGLG
jgi:YD repeat-containing protein